MMRENPKKQEIYRHFKGNEYKIITLAEDSETGEEMVVYQAMYGEEKAYVRGLTMFMQEVDKEKYPEAKQIYRFEKIEDKQETEEYYLEPKVMEYLEADTYAQKLEILSSIRDRVTDDMINTMAMAHDIPLQEGDTKERYDSLCSALKILEKYECTRLR